MVHTPIRWYPYPHLATTPANYLAPAPIWPHSLGRLPFLSTPSHVWPPLLSAHCPSPQSGPCSHLPAYPPPIWALFPSDSILAHQALTSVQPHPEPHLVPLLSATPDTWAPYLAPYPTKFISVFVSIPPHMGWSHFHVKYFSPSVEKFPKQSWSNPTSINKVLYESSINCVPISGLSMKSLIYLTKLSFGSTCFNVPMTGKKHWSFPNCNGKSVNTSYLESHWSTNRGQFKDAVCFLCLMVVWQHLSLLNKGLQSFFTTMFHWIKWKHLAKTIMSLFRDQLANNTQIAFWTIKFKSNFQGDHDKNNWSIWYCLFTEIFWIIKIK